MSADPSELRPPDEIPPLEEWVEAPPARGLYWILLIVGFFGYIGLFLLGGIYERFALAGLEPLPFLVLAILAYIGDRHRDARIVADIEVVRERLPKGQQRRDRNGDA